MGFLDSFKDGFEKQTKAIDATRKDNYKTAKEIKEEIEEKAEQKRYNELWGQHPKVLVEKIRDNLTSERDKRMIAAILAKRGYDKNSDGRWVRL
jgi:16S rRNA C967 or C1407 C5-methylase (RsmB/RsmF family)